MDGFFKQEDKMTQGVTLPLAEDQIQSLGEYLRRLDALRPIMEGGALRGKALVKGVGSVRWDLNSLQESDPGSVWLQRVRARLIQRMFKEWEELLSRNVILTTTVNVRRFVSHVETNDAGSSHLFREDLCPRLVGADACNRLMDRWLTIVSKITSNADYQDHGSRRALEALHIDARFMLKRRYGMLEIGNKVPADPEACAQMLRRYGIPEE